MNQDEMNALQLQSAILLKYMLYIMFFVVGGFGIAMVLLLIGLILPKFLYVILLAGCVLILLFINAMIKNSHEYIAYLTNLFGNNDNRKDL